MRIIRIGFVMLVMLCMVDQGMAQPVSYAIADIPPSLITDANAVVRLQRMRFEILDTRRTLLRHHYAISILNENGEGHSGFAEYFDKYRDIRSIEGNLYDTQGRLIRKMKKREIQDVSGVSGETLMDDTRIRLHNFYNRNYPYTIEYIVEIESKGTLFFPEWSPQSAERLSVEHSSMTIVCPRDYLVRYKAFGYDQGPKVGEEKNNKTLTWMVNDLPVIIREPFSPNWHELSTKLIFAPSGFQVEDHKGTMNTWKDFGIFVQALKQGRAALPAQVKSEIHKIADGIPAPLEKVIQLYQFMQSQTRYVSIQLGIGSWQPYDATYVATRRYGDCKALVNYMYAILKEVGIESSYALVRAGVEGHVSSDFPSQQFNHVILCVPLKNDTVWLECTSQTMPAGYLGGFTSDRLALLVNESGGTLVRTPRYDMNDNRQSRRITSTLDEDGVLHMVANTRYTALQQDVVHELIHQLTQEKVNEYLHQQLDLATYDINKFDYREEKGRIPSVNESLDVTVRSYATVTGKRIFINPNIMTRSQQHLVSATARKYDIELGRGYTDSDSVEIILPVGYTIESLPSHVSLQTVFGKYNATVELKGNRLTYYRHLQQRGGRYPAEDFGNLVKFYDAIYKADRSNVVLIREMATAD